MAYHPNIHHLEVGYKRYNRLILTIDPKFLGHPSINGRKLSWGNWGEKKRAVHPRSLTASLPMMPVTSDRGGTLKTAYAMEKRTNKYPLKHDFVG